MAYASNIASDDDTFDVDAVFDYESFNRLFNEADPNPANLTPVNEVTDPVPPPTGFVYGSAVEFRPSTSYVYGSGDGTADTNPNLISVSEANVPVRPSNGFVRGSGEVPTSTGYVSWSGNGIADANANANLITIREATAPVPSVDDFISGMGDDIADANDLTDDPMIWNLDNEFNQVNSLPGPSTVPVQDGNGGAGDSDNTGFGWPSLRLAFWPPLPEPFRCSCCQVLRELVHTDGTVTTKLEIHGRLDMIHHAILEIRNKINATLHTPDCHMFDFCARSIKQVKQFLVKYCRERKVSGFVKVQDPFSGFYEAVCVGMDMENSVNVNAEVDDFLNLSPTTSSGDGQIENSEMESGTTNVPNTTLVTQHRRGRGRRGRGRGRGHQS